MMDDRELANQMIFGKVDQQLILMAFAFLVNKNGGFEVSLDELRAFAEAEEPVDLTWVVDNTGKKLTFKTEAPPTT